MDIHLIAMAMPLADQLRAVDASNDAIAVELGGISAEAHRPTEVAAGGALLEPLFAHPLGDHADDRFGRLSELGGRGFADPGLVSRRLDARHLHTQANAEERDVALTGEFDRRDLALAATLAESAGDENAMQRLELGRDLRIRMLEQFCVEPLDG